MGCGLRKEIEGMLSLVEGAGGYRLKCRRRGRRGFSYTVFGRRFGYGWWDFVVGGDGQTKAGALRALLENWRGGKAATAPRAPAMSREELRMKLAVYGKAK